MCGRASEEDKLYSVEYNLSRRITYERANALVRRVREMLARPQRENLIALNPHFDVRCEGRGGRGDPALSARPRARVPFSARPRAAPRRAGKIRVRSLSRGRKCI